MSTMVKICTLYEYGIANAEIKLGHKVVTNLTTRVEHKGHVIVIDDFFTNVAFFAI